MASTRKPMLAADIKQHPEFPHVIWDLKADTKEKVAVGEGRGGPFKIAYEIHGRGPQKLVLIMGLGGLMTSWQRQTKDFGHTEGDKYSVLILDNRGIGESDKPLMRYSTSEMAKDVIEVTDHIGWTDARQLHVIGISMGGMIAQELGMLIPDRIATLNLISTGSQIVNTLPVIEHYRNRINMFIPKSLDDQIANAKRMIYTADYLVSEDDTECIIKPFPTSGDRFAAAEIWKRESPEHFTRLGFICQALAAGWHYKSQEQLRELADKIGRDRILVMHGTADRMVPFPHAGTLVAGLDMGVTDASKKVRREFVDGQGHIIPIEKREFFREVIVGMVEKAQKLK